MWSTVRWASIICGARGNLALQELRAKSRERQPSDPLHNGHWLCREGEDEGQLGLGAPTKVGF